MRVNFLYDNWMTNKAMCAGMDILSPFPEISAKELLAMLLFGTPQVSDEAKMSVAFNLLVTTAPDVVIEDGGCYVLVVDHEAGKFGVKAIGKGSRKDFVELVSKRVGCSRKRVEEALAGNSGLHQFEHSVH